MGYREPQGPRPGGQGGPWRGQLRPAPRAHPVCSPPPGSPQPLSAAQLPEVCEQPPPALRMRAGSRVCAALRRVCGFPRILRYVHYPKRVKKIPDSEQTAQITREAEQRRTRCPGGWEIVSPTYHFLAFEILDLNACARDQSVLGTASGEAGLTWTGAVGAAVV